MPYPVYQDQEDLVTALTHRGLPLAQINSVVAAMLLADNGTYRGDFTLIPGASSDKQANIYNAQVQISKLLSCNLICKTMKHRGLS
ncbi:hypothetical protein ACI3E1_06720 [Ligilactobacillus sp. LYQ139]|uniref:hypothetical protein n=1 Tax=Ligilactobacillus sp. LYQ139 TaxID=3378800 RepID=UPI0038522FDD